MTMTKINSWEITCDVLVNDKKCGSGIALQLPEGADIQSALRKFAWGVDKNQVQCPICRGVEDIPPQPDQVDQVVKNVPS